MRHAGHDIALEIGAAISPGSIGGRTGRSRNRAR
jgi:hypothetical protein